MKFITCVLINNNSYMIFTLSFISITPFYTYCGVQMKVVSLQGLIWEYQCSHLVRLTETTVSNALMNNKQGSNHWIVLETSFAGHKNVFTMNTYITTDNVTTNFQFKG